MNLVMMFCYVSALPITDVRIGDTDVIAPDNNCDNGGVFGGWRDQPTTNLSSFMFDTTPAKYIKAVISEHGTLGPTNCPNVLRANSSSAPLR